MWRQSHDTAVRSIKKQQLVEVRSMANPPSVVKMALESICTLLGEKGDTWKGIRSAVMKDNFISTIVNFETENITLVCWFIIKLTTDWSLHSPKEAYKTIVSDTRLTRLY